MPTRLRRSAPALDAACFVVFVVLGRDQHGIHSGVWWVLGVVWPLLLGWFLAALITRLYVRAERPWARLLATLVLGVLIGGPLHAMFGGAYVYSTFTIVELVFIGLFTFGWRGVMKLIVRRSRRAGVAP